MTPKLKDHQKSCSHFKGFPNYRSARHRTRGNILGWELTQTQPTLQKDQLLQRSFSCTEKPLCRPSILCDVQSKHTTGVFFKSLSKKVFLLSVPPLAEWLSHPTGAVQWNGNQDMLEMSAFHFYPIAVLGDPLPCQGYGTLGLVWYQATLKVKICDVLRSQKAVNKIENAGPHRDIRMI